MCGFQVSAEETLFRLKGYLEVYIFVKFMRRFIDLSFCSVEGIKTMGL